MSGPNKVKFSLNNSKDLNITNFEVQVNSKPLQNSDITYVACNAKVAVSRFQDCLFALSDRDSFAGYTGSITIRINGQTTECNLTSTNPDGSPIANALSCKKIKVGNSLGTFAIEYKASSSSDFTSISKFDKKNLSVSVVPGFQPTGSNIKFFDCYPKEISANDILTCNIIFDGLPDGLAYDSDLTLSIDKGGESITDYVESSGVFSARVNVGPGVDLFAVEKTVTTSLGGNFKIKVGKGSLASSSSSSSIAATYSCPDGQTLSGSNCKFPATSVLLGLPVWYVIKQW